MIAEILGIGQRRSGTSKASGRAYDITPIYCVYPASGVDGEKTDEIVFDHLSGMVFPNIRVGNSIRVSYDKHGFLDEFCIIEKDGKVPQGGNLKITNS